jgi:hypothetical protein
MSESAAETTGTETTGTETETEATETPTTEVETTETETTETEGNDPRVKRANAQAAAERVKRREVEQQLAAQGETLAKLAAVFNPESTTEDPAQQLANITTEAESLRTETAQLRAELLVHTIAGDNGGNPVALLDSRTFTNKLHGLDPSADEYPAQVAEAIKDAVSKNASLSQTAGQGPSRGGAPGAGQGAAQPDGAVTQEQFNGMSYADRAQLFQTNPDLYRRLNAGTRT